MVTTTYLPAYLWENSDSSDSSDSSNSSDKIKNFTYVFFFNFSCPLNCDNSKTQIVTKLNSNCDKTQKRKLWQNTNTQIVTKVNSNCDKTKQNCIVTKKLWQLWQNPNNQIVTKLKNSNYDKMGPN